MIKFIPSFSSIFSQLIELYRQWIILKSQLLTTFHILFHGCRRQSICSQLSSMRRRGMIYKIEDSFLCCNNNFSVLIIYKLWNERFNHFQELKITHQPKQDSQNRSLFSDEITKAYGSWEVVMTSPFLYNILSSDATSSFDIFIVIYLNHIIQYNMVFEISSII